MTPKQEQAIKEFEHTRMRFAELTYCKHCGARTSYSEEEVFTGKVPNNKVKSVSKQFTAERKTDYCNDCYDKIKEG